MRCRSSSAPLLAALLGLAFLLGLPGIARADKADKKANARAFKEYIDEGARAFQAENYAAAIEALAAAYKIEPAPPILFNLGRAHQKAGHDLQALIMYERFLQADPETQRRAEAEGYIKELRARLLYLEPPPPPLKLTPDEVLALQRAAPKPRPLYREPWFWGAIAITAVVTAGITAGIVIAVKDEGKGTSHALTVISF